MAKIDKTAARIRKLFNNCNHKSRTQWEYVNQKGFDFSNDNQLTEEERRSLEEQGMPTFTINRILPVVEMLNYYATASNPRWQAVAAEGSDTNVAALFSDVADYIWYNSDGQSLYSNAINDAITKSLGWLMVTVNPDSDNGLGDVIVTQPDPFDIYVDPKSRDMLFRDAGFIMVRKLLPISQLEQMFPGSVRKIKKASSDENTDYTYTEKSMGIDQKDFDYKDIDESESVDPRTGETDKLLEFFEVHEKVKVPLVNITYKLPPDPQQMEEIQSQAAVQIEDMEKELKVELIEQEAKMREAVEAGQMLKPRYELEMEKAQEMMQAQLQSAKQEFAAQIQETMSQVINKIISKKEFNQLMKDEQFKRLLIDQVPFYGSRIKQTGIVGDVTLYENVLPENIEEYPLIPFSFKWTGTPYPMSAVAPLIGKQREMNKAHQIMVHNASLGSSLRWMHEEGSIDTDYWEKYSSSPGALLPIRPGAVPPTAIQPAPLSNAFFSIVQEGKNDMEYLAGIYGAMQGDTGAQHDTYRGMLAMDEYGTRRVKQWMKNNIEPGLRQLGKVIAEMSRAVYQDHRIFRIIQPNNVNEEKQVEINIPIYNDFGDVVGKQNDYSTLKFDVRIIAGSTLPVNRWAYLDELKELMKLGVIDDIALLAETDLRNKENIIKRKSMYSQLQNQIGQLEEQMKNAGGTIETLERQLVQAGIKGKVLQASMEVNSKKNEVKSRQEKEYLETQAQQKVLRETQRGFAEKERTVLKTSLNQVIKDLQNKKQES
tara:strand:+ start:1382 stop:3682 length:2301 start_codon:yes stop_codon:yes gene_type:complete